MIYAICGLVAIILVLSALLWISVRKNLEFEGKFQEIGEQIDESLDILNDCYQRIAKVSEIPVTSDDPYIQQLVADIKHAKNAILLVANKVVTFDSDEDEQE